MNDRRSGLFPRKGLARQATSRTFRSKCHCRHQLLTTLPALETDPMPWYTGFLHLCCKATTPDASSLPYLLQRQTHPSTCAPPRSACSTLLILIVSYPIMHCLQGMGVQEEGFLANSLYYSALIDCVYSANLTSLLFLFRPQPIREDEGKFCQRDWDCYSWCGTPVYLCRSHILQLASLCRFF